MNTGKLWGSTPTIYQAYEGAMWRPGDTDQACSLSSVLALDMSKHTTGKQFFFTQRFVDQSLFNIVVKLIL